MAKAKQVEQEAPEAEGDEFDALLKGSWDNIPIPGLLPDGTYVVKGRNVAIMKAKEEGQNPRVVFFHKVVEPTDDVDEDKLAELGEDYDFNENQVTTQFFIEGGRDWGMVANYLRLFGIEPSDYENIKASFKAFTGKTAYGRLGTRSYTNKAGQSVTENTLSDVSAIDGE